MPVISSISGLRATIKDSLTDKLIYQYINAFAKVTEKGKIIIGNDGRPSGKYIQNLISNILIEKGFEIIDLGIVPTPFVQLYTENMKAKGGIAITASHNPAEWNGLKFINSQGVFFNKEENEVLWKYLDLPFDEIKAYQNNDNNKKNQKIENHTLHIQLLEQIFPESLIEKARNQKLKVVVDAVNASGSFVIPQLLEFLGCDVIRLFCKGDGDFPHIPEPLPENLSLLSDAVKTNKAMLGVAVDPDADRLVLVDENGELIGEERTITIATKAAFEFFEEFKNKYEKAVCINLSTTKAVEDVAKEYDAKIFRSPVGEINVVNLMKEHNAFIGGEGSGGVIFPEFHYGRDSIIGTALIILLLAKKSKTLSEINNSIPSYKMLKTKINFDGSLTEVILKIKQKYSAYKIWDNDGIRVDLENSWVQIRKSNTEPIIRIIAEATTKAEAEALINSINALL